MNIRKNIDYSEMYVALDTAIATGKEQMKLYTLIGQAVCRRTEKGAAVAAAEYLSKRYPDVQGFSPRNLRRMRDFCRTYENHPVLLSLAMNLSWTQNVVIMEADLTIELREWYLRAARKFGWSKTELIDNIAANAHENIVLAIDKEMCYIVEQEERAESQKEMTVEVRNVIRQGIRRIRKWWLIWKGGGRRWRTMLWEISMEKQTASMRC